MPRAQYPLLGARILDAKPRHRFLEVEEGAAGEALLHLGALGHYGLYEENGEFAEVFDLSTFVSNCLAIFFAAFFAAFFTTLDFLVFLGIL